MTIKTLEGPEVYQKYIEMMTAIHKYVVEKITQPETCKDCDTMHDLMINIDITQPCNKQ